MYDFKPREKKAATEPDPIGYSPGIEEQKRILSDFSNEVKLEGKDLISQIKLPVGMVSFDETIRDFLNNKARRAEMKGETFIWEDNYDAAIEDVEVAAMKASAIARLSTLENIDGGVLQEILVDHINRFGPITIDSDEKREVLKYIVKYKMYEMDIQTVLLRFRQVSVGNYFEFQLKCDNCGHVGKYKVKVSDMKVEWPEGERVGVESKRDRIDSVTRMGLTFKFGWHWNRTGDIERVKKIVEAFERLDRMDEINFMTLILLQRLRKVWVPTGNEVDGEPEFREHVLYYEPGDKPSDEATIVRDPVKFIADLPGWFFMQALQVIQDKEPGIDFKVEVECESCGHETAFMMNPVGRGFFTPLEIQDT
jgi:hypothetical protein